MFFRLLCFLTLLGPTASLSNVITYQYEGGVLDFPDGVSGSGNITARMVIDERKLNQTLKNQNLQHYFSGFCANDDPGFRCPDEQTPRWLISMDWYTGTGVSFSFSFDARKNIVAWDWKSYLAEPAGYVHMTDEYDLFSCGGSGPDNPTPGVFASCIPSYPPTEPFGYYDAYGSPGVWSIASNIPAPVPLPAALPLLAVGLGWLGFIGRRKKKTA